MHLIFYFQPFTVFDLSTRETKASIIEALGLLFEGYKKAIPSTVKVSGVTVEIMGTPYPHGMYIRLGRGCHV
jgi:hypothetical protein